MPVAGIRTPNLIVMSRVFYHYATWGRRIENKKSFQLLLLKLNDGQYIFFAPQLPNIVARGSHFIETKRIMSAFSL